MFAYHKDLTIFFILQKVICNLGESQGPMVQFFLK